MSQIFLDNLSTGKLLVSDGATGTNLQRHGLNAGISPETWVIEKPEKILELETAFVRAGSNIILTCTFGGTCLRLKDTIYSDRVAEVNHRAVEIARRAATEGDGVMVAGSIGPVGGLIKPYGSLTLGEVSDAYRQQSIALIEAGVDLIVIETQFSLEEAQAALESVQRISDLPVVVSFSFDRGLRTMMGVKPSQVVSKFQSMGVAAIGANCGTSLENMEAIIKEYKNHAQDLPIWAKPNAGMPELDENGITIFKVNPHEMGEATLGLIKAGANIIGGCCGNTPDHISQIARSVIDYSDV
jgi:5-methyltetrahydrofolate--homocysteine methyltransferase